MRVKFYHLKDALKFVDVMKSPAINFTFRENNTCDITVMDITAGSAFLRATVMYESEEHLNKTMWITLPGKILWGKTDEAVMTEEDLTVGDMVYRFSVVNEREDLDRIQKHIHIQETKSVWVSPVRLREILSGYGRVDAVKLNFAGELDPVRIEYEDDFGTKTAYLMPVKK